MKQIRADYWEPETPPGPAHLKLSIPGAVALFAAGALCAATVTAALFGTPLFALAGAIVTAALLLIAALDAANEPERGWYTRQRGSLLFRRTAGGLRHG